MLVKAIRFIKRQIIGGESRYRRVRYGIAAGYQMPIDRQNNFRLELGIYEPELKKYMQRFCKGVRVAYDVGTAQGYYVLAFCKLMESDGKVYAFEATENLVEELEETLRINNLLERVHVVRAYVSDVDDGETLSIDGITANGAFPIPDLVKIDVEGAELKVLQGMEGVLEKASPSFIIEVHSLDLENQCLEFLARHNYRTKVIEPGWLDKILPEYRPAEHNQWIVAKRKKGAINKVGAV